MKEGDQPDFMRSSFENGVHEDDHIGDTLKISSGGFRLPAKVPTASCRT
ncbi:unnamed protein product, partial [Heterotrigona itama]